MEIGRKSSKAQKKKLSRIKKKLKNENKLEGNFAIHCLLGAQQYLLGARSNSPQENRHTPDKRLNLSLRSKLEE